MVKRKKGRCVRNNTQVKEESEEVITAPHSIIIHRGLPGGNLVDIMKDFRKVMEPFTAASLKERKKNTIKDFVQIAGVLHVSHICIFTRTDVGMYFKIAKVPRGPTLTFKVHNFILAKDVISSLKKQFVTDELFRHSPLVVMNNFSGEGMHMKLMASTFQNMFPTINLTSIDLNTIRRCVLLNYNPTTKLVDFRHYAIKVIPVGISKGVKKVVQGKVPNLAKCNDIADFLTKTAMLSESEFEDDAANQVTLPQKIISRGNIESNQSAIRVSELGPRLTLQLMKVEDGLLDGEVLFHELVYKTEEEVEIIKKKRDKKRKLKENRKYQQELNTKKKADDKEAHKQKSLKGIQKGKTESDRLMKKAAAESNRETNLPEDDDVEYYRQEVGEEPDMELFSSKYANRKRALPPKEFDNKKPRLDENPKRDHFKDKNPRFEGKPKFEGKPRFEGKPGRNQSEDRKFDKNKKQFGKKKDSTPSGGKWPGGRGGNPRYGLNAITSEDIPASKFDNKKPKFDKKKSKFDSKKSKYANKNAGHRKSGNKKSGNKVHGSKVNKNKRR